MGIQDEIKTSLIINLHNSNNDPKSQKRLLERYADNIIFIDLQDVSPDSITQDIVMQKIKIGINEFVNNNDNINFADVVGFVDFQKNGDTITISNSSMPQILRNLDEWAADKNSFVVIAINNAEVLNNTSNYNMSGILASIYDNNKNTGIVLLGNDIKSIDNFVSRPDLYLCGRYFPIIDA